MITVLVVDDEATVREGLRMRLALEEDLFVIGEAGSGNEALVKTLALEPDVVLLDVEMGDMDGIAVTARLRDEGAPTAVVILTIHGDARTRARAEAAGATAFVEKHSPDSALLSAIQQAAHPPPPAPPTI
jgi:DNA-binding NarL/FixJ family response regulator